MQKLKFIFKNGEEEIINETVEYSKNDEYFEFFLDSIKYSVKLGDECEFIRETKKEIFKIGNLGNINKASVTLKNEKQDFFIGIKSFNYLHKNLEYVIRYSLESDKDNIKTIIINMSI